ncbi:MAG TPA: hypothetical protein PLA01_05635 [Acetivibrio sp.]|nr:hypothetical protein [Acetivibrio sp.]
MSKLKPVFIVFLCLLLLPACGKKEPDRSNAQAFLEYAIHAADATNFLETGNYAGVMLNLKREYKDDIVNPYTKGDTLAVFNRTRAMFKNNKTSLTKYFSVDCLVIDDYVTTLKDLDTSEVVYCLNAESKGMVLAFFLMDGIYIYEVDENGEKKNEIKHFFEKKSKETD